MTIKCAECHTEYKNDHDFTKFLGDLRKDQPCVCDDCGSVKLFYFPSGQPIEGNPILAAYQWPKGLVEDIVAEGQSYLDEQVTICDECGEPYDLNKEPTCILEGCPQVRQRAKKQQPVTPAMILPELPKHMKMTKKAKHSYQEYINVGWTDSLLLEEGLAELYDTPKLPTMNVDTPMPKVKPAKIDENEPNEKYLKQIFPIVKPIVFADQPPVYTYFVDVYRVLDAFTTDSASIDHAVKKILCAGNRHDKDWYTDMEEAIWSLRQAIILQQQKDAEQ